MSEPAFLDLPDCPVCGRTGRPLGRIWTYVRAWEDRVPSDFAHCGHCEFGWMTNPPDGASLAAYYRDNDQYRREGLTTEEAHHIADQVRFLAPPAGRHLEIGPDNGAFLDLLRLAVAGEFSFDEMNEGAAARLAAKGYTPPSGRYDTVTLRHVFEHIVDPVAFLRSLKDRAERIFVEVPDYSFVASGHSDRFQLEHVNYFSLTAMHRIALAAGLSIERAEFARTPGYSTTPNRVLRVVFAAGTADDAGAWEQLLREEQDVFDRFAAKTAAGGQRVAVYGGGAVTLSLMASGASGVVAIYDADPKKQGTSLLGTAIASPEAIDPAAFDVLVLTVVGYEKEVREFLSGRVPDGKIKTLQEFVG